MAIRINNKEYLTYEEQVLKNKTDVEKINDKLVEMGKKGIYQDILWANLGEPDWEAKITRLTGIGYNIYHLECELEDARREGVMVSFTGDDNDNEFTVNLSGKKVKIEYHDDNPQENNKFILKVYVNDELAYSSNMSYMISTNGAPLILRNVKIW